MDAAEQQRLSQIAMQLRASAKVIPDGELEHCTCCPVDDIGTPRSALVHRALDYLRRIGAGIVSAEVVNGKIEVRYDAKNDGICWNLSQIRAQALQACADELDVVMIRHQD
jgi:hypothetical protein